MKTADSNLTMMLGQGDQTFQGKSDNLSSFMPFSSQTVKTPLNIHLAASQY